MTDKRNIQRLSTQLERAAFEFRLALEDDDVEPSIPPSKLAETVSSPANALERAVNQIKGFPRQTQSDLLRVANKMGDRCGRQPGATDFFDIIDQVGWAVACLRELEKIYRDNVAQRGGNRDNVARKRFFDALDEIMEEWHDGPLKGWVDPSKNKASGSLPQLLEICFSPIKHKPPLDSLVKAFRAHVKANKNLRHSDNVP